MDWAVAMGINEAFICQQILYWCSLNRRKNINYKDGHFWTYNTFNDWQEQFPCLSIATIGRTIARLKKKGYIIIGKYNESKWIHTSWYRLNPEYFSVNDTPPAARLAPVGKNGKAKGCYEDGEYKKFRLPVMVGKPMVDRP